MKLFVSSILVVLLVSISQIDANPIAEKSYIIVLGGQNSVMSRGINARVSVSNDGQVTSIKSQFGNMDIKNDLVPRDGYVVEGNDSLDSNKCYSGELQKIIMNCNGKLLVRSKTQDDVRKFSEFSFGR